MKKISYKQFHKLEKIEKTSEEKAIVFLQKRPHFVSELAERIGLSQPRTSTILIKLAKENLIEKRKRGVLVYYGMKKKKTL